jgi:cobalt-zinc-cadmium resistance protein CzcA
MLNSIINWSLNNRFLVIVGLLGLVVVGGLAVTRLNIDAFPDITPVQVQVNTVAPALTPEEVERQITFPVEQALSGLKGMTQVRSISKFGLSQITATFDDEIDIYFARQQILERLTTVELEAGSPQPEMGPVATGLGEVFHYVVTGRGTDLSDVRTVQDWVIKPMMRTVAGTAEVNSWGGLERQYQVRIDPRLLVKYGLTFSEVTDAVRNNNLNVGGGNIVQSGEMMLVQGVARTSSIDQIENIVVTSQEGVPVLVRNVAEVTLGHEIRRGAVTHNGRGEVVLGLGFMLMGENPNDVTWRMKDKLEELKSTLPKTVRVETVYDRTELVGHVIDTVRKNLFEGGLLVIAVLFVFLGNLRAGLIVAAAIPLAMVFAFSGMWRFGIAASLLSLGALDFGLVVDSSVVMVENVVRRLSHGEAEKRTHLEVVRDAAIEVRKPTMFGELIIMIVYLPILTLEGVEGKLFRPMALTVIFALVGSLILSLTLMPVLCSLILPRRMEESEPFMVRLALRIYAPVLRLAMRARALIIGSAIGLLVIGGLVASQLGSEFVPKLSEGALVIGVTRLPGTSLEDSVRYNTRMERMLREAFPDEVGHVWSRVGTAEVATDPMGVELTDMFVTLKSRAEWKKAKSQEELVGKIESLFAGLPGQVISFSQPIELRINEMVSGVRADVAVKLFGDDFNVLVTKAAEIKEVLGGIAGAADLSVEQITGQPVLRVTVRQDQLARNGVSARAVLDLIESIGGLPLGQVYQGQFRFPLSVRLPEQYRTDAETIGSMLLPTPSGGRIPLSRLADIEIVEGPSTIPREWSQRRITVQANVRGRDVGSFVAEAQRKLTEKKIVETAQELASKSTTAQGDSTISGRYRLEWGGQFENLERAKNRLVIVVPLALAMILALLYFTFNSVSMALLVFTGVPLAAVGGVLALWLRGMPFSISAGVGFIALSGVSVLNALVLVSHIRQLREEGLDVEKAVEQAALDRLRPVLMTALVAGLGFFPMAFSTGMGAEVQHPLATVVIGGIVTSTALTLLVVPAIYHWFDRQRTPHLGG